MPPNRLSLPMGWPMESSAVCCSDLRSAPLAAMPVAGAETGTGGTAAARRTRSSRSSSGARN
eukprot:12291385-Prorocentrum_lima.AAC.1